MVPYCFGQKNTQRPSNVLLCMDVEPSPKPPFPRIATQKERCSTKAPKQQRREPQSSWKDSIFKNADKVDQLVECTDHPCRVQWLSAPSELWILSYFSALQGWVSPWLPSWAYKQHKIMVICDPGRQCSFVLPLHPCMHCTSKPSQVSLFVSRGSSHTVYCAEVGFNWHYYSTKHFFIAIPIYISLGETLLSFLLDLYTAVHDSLLKRLTIHFGELSSRLLRNRSMQINYF